MNSPIFVKSRQHYWDCGDEECMKTHSASYTDFWDLVRFASFETCYTDEIDWQSSNIYICIYFTFPLYDGVGEAFPEDRKNTMILWDLERYDDGKEVDRRFDQQWVSDRWYNAMLPGSKYVILGTDFRLSGDTGIEVPKGFDLIHLSYLTDRRKKVVDYLENGLNMSIAPNGWGNARHEALLRSTAMLAVHQDDRPMTEPLRYALAVAYQMPILAEDSADYFPFSIDESLPFPEEMHLHWLKYPTVDYRFKENVLQALTS